jgi:hypothetical protein
MTRNVPTCWQKDMPLARKKSESTPSTLKHHVVIYLSTDLFSGVSNSVMIPTTLSNTV